MSFPSNILPNLKSEHKPPDLLRVIADLNKELADYRRKEAERFNEMRSWNAQDGYQDAREDYLER